MLTVVWLDDKLQWQLRLGTHTRGVANGRSGFDAFLPLIDSGISLYVWESRERFATALFACKAFSEESAAEYSRNFFNVTELEHQAF